jgi:hypothetical protein
MRFIVVQEVQGAWRVQDQVLGLPADHDGRGLTG